MSENTNDTSLLTDDMDFETPDHAWKTLKRLWQFISNQQRRLAVVFVSVIFYTFLSIVAPLYSAHIVDLLWNRIKEAFTHGSTFSISWTEGGQDIFFLLLIYLAAAFFYALQSFLMSSFAETLSLRREQKLARN